jgi:hypothetical protein
VQRTKDADLYRHCAQIAELALIAYDDKLDFSIALDFASDQLSCICGYDAATEDDVPKLGGLTGLEAFFRLLECLLRLFARYASNASLSALLESLYTVAPRLTAVLEHMPTCACSIVSFQTAADSHQQWNLTTEAKRAVKWCGRARRESHPPSLLSSASASSSSAIFLVRPLAVKSSSGRLNNSAGAPYPRISPLPALIRFRSLIIKEASDPATDLVVRAKRAGSISRAEEFETYSVPSFLKLIGTTPVSRLVQGCAA